MKLAPELGYEPGSVQEIQLSVGAAVVARHASRSRKFFPDASIARALQKTNGRRRVMS